LGEILFVGKYEEESIAKFIFIEHALQLLAGFRNTLTVVRVDYEDDTLRVLKVCAIISGDRRNNWKRKGY
jgi:hypothetical protein